MAGHKTGRSVIVSMRMTPELKELAEDLAWKDRRTLSSLMEVALQEYVQNHHHYCPTCKGRCNQYPLYINGE